MTRPTGRRGKAAGRRGPARPARPSDAAGLLLDLAEDVAPAACDGERKTRARATATRKSGG